MRKEADRVDSASNGTIKERHWILMMDADVGVDWPTSALLEAIGHETRWQVLCAHTWYREGSLYDAFALRLEGVPKLRPSDFESLRGRSFFPHALCGSQRLWGKRCDCGMEGLADENQTCSSCAASSAANSLIPVESCFGGLALYHEDLLHKFKACKYDEGMDDCEHVALNSCLRSQKATVVLSPNLAAPASASNSTCCVETCTQAESFPMTFLPFQPQFWTSSLAARVSGLVAAGMSLEEAGKPQEAFEKYQDWANYTSSP